MKSDEGQSRGGAARALAWAGRHGESIAVYDSVAEAYAVNGQQDLAIKNYKRSLELDPQNTNAVRQLKKLDPSLK